MKYERTHATISYEIENLCMCVCMYNLVTMMTVCYEVTSTMCVIWIYCTVLLKLLSSKEFDMFISERRQVFQPQVCLCLAVNVLELLLCGEHSL